MPNSTKNFNNASYDFDNSVNNETEHYYNHNIYNNLDDVQRIQQRDASGPNGVNGAAEEIASRERDKNGRGKNSVKMESRKVIRKSQAKIGTQ